MSRSLNLDTYLRSRREQVDACLDALLPVPDGPAATVARAMRYAVMGGGKRLRPILAMAAAAACGGREEDLLEPAAALEMIHTYSLIHDDLPAMDDDDLRRGRPTAHRAFGEAEAILAGDALQCLAFEILGSRPAGDGLAGRRAAAVVTVARGSGCEGMVGGQMADLEAERSASVDGPRLEWIHRHKTGALFAAAAELGAIHAGAPREARSAVTRYGQALGLAFQIADDILDRTSTREQLGKTPGKDLESGKSTYPAMYGLEASRVRARTLVERALDELTGLGPSIPVLESIARFAVSRSH